MDQQTRRYRVFSLPFSFSLKRRNRLSHLGALKKTPSKNPGQLQKKRGMRGRKFFGSSMMSKLYILLFFQPITETGTFYRPSVKWKAPIIKRRNWISQRTATVQLKKNRKKEHPASDQSTQSYPTDPFTTLELQNPPLDVPELYKIRRFGSYKIVKCPVG